jgi:hypothetical protein
VTPLTRPHRADEASRKEISAPTSSQEPAAELWEGATARGARLALSRVEVEPRSAALDHRIIAALITFWKHAVFLRLSPQQISRGSSLTRRSFDPILDEETAILALLLRRPPPTLLCIEEIENGLDPWTVLDVLARLQAAPLDGTQVLITSHSPWLLDHMELDAIRISQRERGQTRYASFRDQTEAQKFLAAVPPGARYVNGAQLTARAS